MQLQGETETIGEYVALYQQQRFLLKQRQLERDDYVSQMARDHQHMQVTMATLIVIRCLATTCVLLKFVPLYDKVFKVTTLRGNH